MGILAPSSATGQFGKTPVPMVPNSGSRRRTCPLVSNALCGQLPRMTRVKQAPKKEFGNLSVFGDFSEWNQAYSA